MPDEWKIVPGWPDYRVNEEGEIQSKRPYGNARVGKGWRTLTPYVNKPSPYPIIQLSRDSDPGKLCTVKMHVLMAATWLGPRPAGQLVLHKNSNPSDYTAGNLRYGTHTENANDRVSKIGRYAGKNKLRQRIPFAEHDVVLELSEAIKLGNDTVELDKETAEQLLKLVRYTSE